MYGSGLRIAFVSLAAAACVVGVGVVGAKADGLPVLGVDVGASGVVASSGEARYVTLPAGRGATIVALVAPNGGQVQSSRLLRGTFTIPAVAYDGSASGLSADGRTLVLIQPRVAFPRTQTALAILDARDLRLRATVKLDGDFSFDAISPHGSWLYLVQYVSPRDPTRYLVRAYDLRAGRLVAAPVTDPRERGEKMRGSPITRATSPDGRWAYTLYDGAGSTPFIHALDTSGRAARCIDLDGISASYASRLRLRVSADGSDLTVRDGGAPQLVVDTRTFRVSAVRERLASLPVPAANRHDSVFTWLLAVGALLAVTAAFLLRLRRRRRLALVH
jgi:hypothetical protein